MIKKEDLQIIIYLRQNARMSLIEISKLTGIPVSTIYDRLKRHEKNAIIKPTLLLNFSELGYHHRANIVIKINKDDKEKFKEFILDHENINSAFEINGGYDYLLETIHINIKDFINFLEDLDKRFKIEKKYVYEIVNDIKREHFMSKR